MAERFRFRLPWLTAARPVAEEQPPRPTGDTPAPARPTTTIPIQRPPFRPAGIAPVVPPPPPQPQAPPRAESEPAMPPPRAATESQVMTQTTAPSRPTQATSVPPSPPRGGPKSPRIAPVEPLPPPASVSQPRIAPVEPLPPPAQAPPTSVSQPAVPPRTAAESQVTSQTKSPTRAPIRTQATSVPPSPSRTRRESQVTSQPASPSRAAAQSRGVSVPPSPSRAATQSRAVSVPPSPSRAATQSRAASVPPSPSRPAQQSRAASVPPSPSATASQIRPAGQTATQPQSPSRLATQQVGLTPSQLSAPSKMGNQVQPTVSQPSPKKKLQPAEETSQPPSVSVQQPSPQKERKLVASLPMSEAPLPKPDIASKTEAVSESPKKTEPLQASSVETVKAPTSTRVPETPAGSEKPAPVLQSVKELEKTEDRKKVLELLKRAGHNGEELPGAVPDIEHRPEKEDIYGRKKKIVISSGGEKIKHANAQTRSIKSHLTPIPSKSNGDKAPLQKQIREDISGFIHKLGTEHPMQSIGETPVSVVTLAGENRGATMHLGTESSRKDGRVHIRRGYKTDPDDSTEATTDGEGSSQRRGSKGPLTKDQQTTRAYINSNTQSVNNSIVFDSSVNERNPGVQLSISQTPAEHTKPSTKPGLIDTRKAEFNITPAEKLTYEPTVRRRCLRGLFLESSDSDPENPEKPRRHGCRYSCGQKSKDKDIGIL